MRRWILRVNHWIALGEQAVLVLLALTMVLGAFVQVLLRNFFQSGIDGMEILLRHMVLWVGFIGASLATRDEKHINIDLFTRFASHRHKRIARIGTDILAIMVTLVLARAGYLFVMSEREFGSTLFGNVPAWPFQLVIPFGFMLMALRFLLNLLIYLFPEQEDTPS